MKKTLDSLSDIQTHAFINVWMAWNNLPKERLLGDALVLTGYMDHLQFKALCKTLDTFEWNIDTLFNRLNEEQRGALIRYCMENYKKVPMETIKRLYRPK